jgi:hypothetical protein
MISAIVAVASNSRKQEKGWGHENCNERRAAPLEMNRTLYDTGSCLQQWPDTKHATATRIGEENNRSEGAGAGRRLTPVVFIGGAIIRRLNHHVVFGDQIAVGEVGQRVVIQIEQWNIEINRAGLGKSIKLQAVEHLDCHAQLLVEGMVSRHRSLQAATPGFADRRFLHELNWHFQQSIIRLHIFHCTTFGLKISE